MKHPLGSHLLRHGLAAAVITAVSVCSLNAQPVSPDVASGDQGLTSEMVTIVERHGWPADIGRACVTFKLGTEADCRFKQIAVSGSEPGTIDNYGFNVPTNRPNDSPLLLFHLGPLVGNFFIVSRDGNLRSAYYRSKGVDYTEIPVFDARVAFERSMAFWKQNLPELKEMIAQGKMAPRR